MSKEAKRFYIISILIPALLFFSGIFLGLNQSSPRKISCDEILNFETSISVDILSELPWQSIGIVSFVILVGIWLSLVILLPIKWYRNIGADRPVYKKSFFNIIFGFLAFIFVLLNIASNQVRPKGADAVVKGYMAGMRVPMEIYFDYNGKYPVVLGSNPEERWEALFRDHQLSGYQRFDHECYVQTKNPLLQYDYINSPSGDRWLATGFLRSYDAHKESLGKWCVDSTGFSGQVQEDTFHPEKTLCWYINK